MSNYANTCKDGAVFNESAVRISNITGQIVAGALTATHTVMQWGERRRQRAALAKLPEYLKRDVGLTDAQIFAEANKPFWVE